MNQKTQYPKRAQLSNWLGFIAAVAIGSSAAYAQEKTATKPNPAVSDETIILSPFVVSADKDNGYAATSSLGGTRLNTNLRDIPASISVVTKEMMNDLGVNNSAQLLTYTLGTEVSGQSGSFSGASVAPGSLAQDGPNRDFLPAARVRGLANADNTRDYFLTDIPWDGFNTDRVEVNRGPNAMLFGTGSPAGIINQSTIKADLDGNRTKSSISYGSFGSSRAELDNNTVLIKDVLSIRTALKYSDDRFMQQEAYIRDRRGFLAATYKPLELTTVRANFEQGRQSSVKPEWRPPFDNGIVSWFEAGKPTINPLTGVISLLGPSSLPSTVSTSSVLEGNMGGGWGADNPTLFFDRPDRIGTTVYGLSGGLFAVTNRAPGYNGTSMRGMKRSGDYQRAKHAGEVGGNAWNEQQFSDASLFDYYNHMLEGENKTEGAKWHVFSATIEQLLPNRKGGVELAYSREYVRSSFNNPFNWATYGVGIDINTVLLDGRPNPNFLRPVIASDSWSTESKKTRENKRATAFYTYQFEAGPEWLRKVLGTHTVTANFSEAEAFSMTSGGRALVAGPEWGYQNPQAYAHLWNGGTGPLTVTNGAGRAIQTLVYLGGAATGLNARSMAVRPVSVDVMVPGVNSVQGYFYKNVYDGPDPKTANSIGGTWQTAGLQILRGSEFDKSNVDLNWTGGKNRSVANSNVYILHSSMFSDTILPTIGYREDKLKFYNGPGDVLNVDGFSESKSPLPAAPSSIFTQYSFNWGGVARLPQSIEAKLPLNLRPSVFYNTSDNFSPTAQRINMYGENVAPSQGQTKEYGVVLSAYQEKLSLRVTHFETGLTGTSIDMRDAVHALVRDGVTPALANIDNGFNDTNIAARDAFKNWWSTSALAANMKSTFGFVGNSSTAVLDGKLMQTKDSVAKGNEIEVTYNPLKNWRIAFNASKLQVTNTNTAVDAKKYLAEIAPTLNGPAGGVWINNSNKTWAQNAQQWVNAVNGLIYSDNQSVNPELRKLRFTALTNYTFESGVLKNIGIGGAVRYADKVLLGTGYKRDALLGDIPDYAKPYFGPSEVQYDAWVSYRRPNIFKHVNLELQLNVRNIGVGKELIPTAVQPDGSIAQWRIKEPMTYNLSSKFSF